MDDVDANQNGMSEMTIAQNNFLEFAMTSARIGQNTFMKDD